MARKNAVEGPSGLIVVDKPAGGSSHSIVARMRRLAQTRKVGHAGTLDPMATGVLILGVNKATKLLTWLVGESKTYTATIRLGLSTLTDDAEGEVTACAPASLVEALTDEQVAAEVARLTGDILQVPSAVSAIKVNGVRSYARVRGGEEVELEARPIRVTDFVVHDRRLVELEAADYGVPVPLLALDLDVTVSCSSGTYIRALARDLGAALGVGGHLTALRRTRVGEIRVEDAYSLEALETLVEGGSALPLLSLEDAARRLFAARQLTAAEATDLSNGRRISPSSPAEVTGGAKSSTHQDHASTVGLTAAFAPQGELVALIENTRFKKQDCAAPVLVFEAGKKYSGEEA